MQGFGAITKIHLVLFFVSAFKVACAADGITKRSIISRRVFGRICHNGGINKIFSIQCLAKRGNTTIHHIAWRDDIRACTGVAQGLFGEDVNGDVIEHVAIVIDNTVLTMTGIGVECHISHHHHLR